MSAEDENVRLLRIPAAPGDGRGGEVLGLPGKSWLLPLAGLVLTLFLLAAAAVPPLVAAAPVVLVSGFTAFFFYQRPPRFLQDWFATRLLGRHAECRPARARASRRAFHPLRRGPAAPLP